eukprot:TRINITY_DN32276_c0_g1_i2.p2 TRINITY_DN32276_c0_g1~~TRINITY_DN32276_c0_g1_i2.p2  ORF type:complete len:130 (+),score=29.40 TRINITY_DN32276_c0_g1_i2:158-547(+)
MGGASANVIPSEAAMNGTIRTLKKEVEEEVVSQLEKIATFLPQALDCKGEFKVTMSHPAVINNPKLAAELRSVIQQLFDEESLTEEMMNASEDFCEMAEIIPAAYMIVGHAIPGKLPIMNHHPLSLIHI